VRARTTIQDRKREVRGCPAFMFTWKHYKDVIFHQSQGKPTQTLQESRHRKKTRADMSKPGTLG